MSKIKIESVTSLFLTELRTASQLLNSKKDCYLKYFSRNKVNFSFSIIAKKTKHIRDECFTIPDLYMCKVHNSKIIGRCGVITSENILLKESLPPWLEKENIIKNKDILKNSYDLSLTNEGYIELNPETKSEFISEPIVIISSATDNAFSHFLFESFAKLHLFGSVDLNKYRWLISASAKQYQIDLLTSFGIPEKNIIKKTHKTNIRATEIIVISPPAHNNVWATPPSLVFLREYFKGQVTKNPLNKKFFPDIYLDRNDERSEMRKIINESNIIKKTNLLGFKAFTPGMLMFSEKIDLISEANFIIGQYGGGMQLCFSANQSAKILVIQSPHFFRAFINFMAVIFGYEAINIMGEKLNNEEAGNNSKIKVSEDDLMMALECLSYEPKKTN